MFTILHGLGYFQKWFSGLFTEDPRKDQGSNFLDPPSPYRSASYQGILGTPHHISALRSPSPFKAYGKLQLQKCTKVYIGMEKMKNKMEHLKYEIEYLRASKNFDEPSMCNLDGQVYEKDDELVRLRHRYDQLETELKRVAFELWLEKLYAKHRGRGWLGLKKSEIPHPSPSYTRSPSQSSNDGYLDEDFIDERDIRINGVCDIVAWDGEAKIESLFIGKGSYGHVSVCRCRKTLQPIAIKEFIFTSESAASQGIHRQIQHEADELAAVVGSDFFPRFYGLVRLSRHHFMLAMEFVGDQKTGKTQSISRALVDHGLAEGEETWFNIAVDVVQGMAELHSRKRLHNDLKADNIMLFRCPLRLRWAAKIIDFGMTSAFDRGKRFSFTDEEKSQYLMRDDYLHIAPEIVLGGAPTSAATDVFSTGYLMRKIAERKGVVGLGVISSACLTIEARHRPTMKVVEHYLDDLRSWRRMTTVNQ